MSYTHIQSYTYILLFANKKKMCFSLGVMWLRIFIHLFTFSLSIFRFDLRISTIYRFAKLQSCDSLKGKTTSLLNKQIHKNIFMSFYDKYIRMSCCGCLSRARAFQHSHTFRQRASGSALAREKKIHALMNLWTMCRSACYIATVKTND